MKSMEYAVTISVLVPLVLLSGTAAAVRDNDNEGSRAPVAPVRQTLSGPHVCTRTLMYDGVVEQTYTFMDLVRTPCTARNSTTQPCIEGFYTTKVIRVGIRNVTRKMEKVIKECCLAYTEVNGTCEQDGTVLAVLITIPLVFVGIVTLACGVCCYCCCRRKRNPDNGDRELLGYFSQPQIPYTRHRR